MVILHIACMKGNRYSGVETVVPQHVRAQQRYAEIALLNVNAIEMPDLDNFFQYDNSFTIDTLPKPFDKPDIVVFHELYSLAYLKISKHLRKKNIPYVIIPHCELQRDAQRKKYLKKFVANTLLFNRYFNGAAAIQCLSQHEMENTHTSVQKFIGTNGTSVPSDCKSTFSESGLRLTYIGRLDPYHKGLDLLIEAVDLSSSDLRQRKAEIDIYGPDNDGNGDAIHKLIETHGVQDLVRLHPPVLGDEKAEVLLNTDVFVQTSRFEGMPMGVLEALSYGLPCLLTTGTTLGEITKEYDAGWCCETNAQDIAEYLVCALDEKDALEKKGAHARKLIEENFAWSRIAEQTIGEYKRIVCGI